MHTELRCDHRHNGPGVNAIHAAVTHLPDEIRLRVDNIIRRTLKKYPDTQITC